MEIHVTRFRGRKLVIWQVRGTDLDGLGHRWWLQTYFFVPNSGEMIQFDKHLWNGLWKPPTKFFGWIWFCNKTQDYLSHGFSALLHGYHMEFIIGKGVNWRNKQFQGKRFSTNNYKLIPSTYGIFTIQWIDSMILEIPSSGLFVCGKVADMINWFASSNQKFVDCVFKYIISPYFTPPKNWKAVPCFKGTN